MTTILSRSSTSFLRSLTAGAIAGVATIAPAMAAPSFASPSFALPLDIATLPGREILLWGSVALLIVALIGKVVQDHQRKEPLQQGPDLRWWKNPPPDLQP